MTANQELQARLPKEPRTWLVTGVAGFLGSNLLEKLLRLDQRVIGLDNFAIVLRRNLDEFQVLLSPEQWARFIHEGDIRKLDDCRRACEGVDYIPHQATLGSVPRSLADSITTNSANSAYRDFRSGDVRHSQADVSKSRRLLGYKAQFEIRSGIAQAIPIPWYIMHLSNS